ncbi:MAG: AI-2E family transporter [Xenococcaceae cyanobacterium MO_188.B29]|nr:AI-2E family transporter [Xenococcaceae cyanobacterium MO_188.B29]
MNLGSWIGFVVLFLCLYVLWQIKQLVLLLFTAVIFANSLNILVKKWQKLGIKRGYAVFLSILILFTILIGFFWLIVPSFVAQFEELILLVPRGIDELLTWLDFLYSRLDPNLITLLPDAEELRQQLQPLLNQILGGGFVLFRNSLAVLLNMLLLLVLTVMLLADPSSYRQGFIRLFPSFYRRRIDEILFLCDEALQGWLIGILFNMAVITVFSFIGLLILGIPLALAQAVLAGILTFIPNLGPTLSVIFPMTIGLIEAPWKPLAVLGLYIGIQQIESNFLTPLVMAKQVSLLPAITLLAQIFFATFFGFLGLFLALPLTVVGQVWFKEVLVRDVLDRWQDSPIIHQEETNLNSSPDIISEDVDLEQPTENQQLAEIPVIDNQKNLSSEIPTVNTSIGRGLQGREASSRHSPSSGEETSPSFSVKSTGDNQQEEKK